MVGFIQTTTPQKTPLVKTDFRHAICFGETGSGKTSSFILPNIEARMKEKYGLFIIDYKGNLDQQIKVLAKKTKRLDDVVELGSSWGQKVNILNGVSKKLFLETCEILDGDSTSKDKFLINSALNVFDILFDIFSLLKHIKDLTHKEDIPDDVVYDMNVKTFVQITRDEDSLRSFHYNLSFVKNFTFDYFAENKLKYSERTAHLILSFKEKMEKRLKDLDTFIDTIEEDRPAAGGGGVLLVVRNLLLTLSADGLNGEDDLIELLDSGKIVVFKSNSFNNELTKAVLHILYTRLATRDIGLKPISLFVDEFQRSVSKKNIPFVDVFREKKVELVCSVQNLQQLENHLGESRCSEFLANIIHHYSYSNRYEQSLETFEYIHNNTKYKASPIFFEDSKLKKVQYDWQIINGLEIDFIGKWIYKKSIDSYSAVVVNINTKKERVYYPHIEYDESIRSLYSKNYNKYGEFYE